MVSEQIQWRDLAHGAQKDADPHLPSASVASQTWQRKLPPELSKKQVSFPFDLAPLFNKCFPSDRLNTQNQRRLPPKLLNAGSFRSILAFGNLKMVNLR